MNNYHIRKNESDQCSVWWYSKETVYRHYKILSLLIKSI